MKIKIVLGGLAFLFVTQLMAQTNKAAKPNIIVIMCDDLGYNDVGFNGSKDITTPNLDELANNGTILKSAYVTHPFCGPSRAGFITGRYPHEIGASYNLSDDGGVCNDGVPVSEIFMSKTLHDAGYYTTAVGKWHLGYNKEFHPNSRGFDDFFGFLGGGHKYYPEEYKEAYKRLLANGNKKISVYLTPLEHNGKDVDEKEYITDAFTREAIRDIKDAAIKKKPLFMYLAYNAPHAPMEAKTEDLKVFENIKDSKRKTYAAMVYAVDRGVGKIVETLKQTNQFDNTLIVFLSDNGGKPDQGASNFPLKGVKGDTWEGGFRVPMFFHWPNNIPAGQTYNFPISSLDFYPTFAKLAGAKIPSSKVIEGKDILTNFNINKDAYKDRMIFALRYRNGFSDVGVRQNDWKLVKMNNATWKLFDIKNDIGENNDLSAKYPQIVAKMVNGAQLWSESHVTPLWFDNDKAKEMWFSTGMPNYDKTFKIDNK